MKINTDYISYLRKDADSYSYGCDYITIALRQNQVLDIRGELNISNTTNSNYVLQCWSLFTYTAGLTKALNSNEVIVHLVHDDISYPVFRIIRFHSTKFGNTIWMVNVYGTVFRLEEIGVIQSRRELLKDFFSEDDYNTLNNGACTRFDFKLDLFYDEQIGLPKQEKVLTGKPSKSTEYNSKLKSRQWVSVPEYVKERIHKMIKQNNMSAVDYTSSKQATGWSNWDPKSKSITIRAYDKILDILNKKKWALYSDYLQYESVNRIEVEMKSRMLRDEDGNSFKLKDFDKIIAIAKAMFWLGFVTDVSRYKYKPNNSILEVTKPYLQQLASRAERVHNNWINPYEFVAIELVQRWSVTKEKTLEQLQEAIDAIELL